MRFYTSQSSITRARQQWLLLSDIHFRAHDLDRIQRTAEWIEALPEKHAIQRVVICGDVLTSRTNQPTHVLSACYRFLGHLVDAVPRVDILLGNHDLAHRRDCTTTALDVLRIGRLAPLCSCTLPCRTKSGTAGAYLGPPPYWCFPSVRTRPN